MAKCTIVRCNAVEVSAVAFERGDKIVDLLDGLGAGEVIDTYVSYHEDADGQTVLVCEFWEDDGYPTVCDRLESQLTRDLASVVEQTVGKASAFG